MARPEDNLNFLNVHTVPNNLTQRFEYNVDGTVLYAGHALKGSAESANVWTVQKFTYTSLQVVSITIAYGNWSGRTGHTYD